MKLLLISVFIFLSSPVLAEKNAPWWNFWKTTEEVTAVTNQLFTKAERSILDEFLRAQGVANDDEKSHKKNAHKKDKGKKLKKQKKLPPGLQKKLARGGELPPGWQKKVARGEVLEGDLYAASRGLPGEIFRRLPKGPDGTSIRHVEDRVVRILDATGVILDVLVNK